MTLADALAEQAIREIEDKGVEYRIGDGQLVKWAQRPVVELLLEARELLNRSLGLTYEDLERNEAFIAKLEGLEK